MLRRHWRATACSDPSHDLQWREPAATSRHPGRIEIRSRSVVASLTLPQCRCVDAGAHRMQPGSRQVTLSVGCRRFAARRSDARTHRLQWRSATASISPPRQPAHFVGTHSVPAGSLVCDPSVREPRSRRRRPWLPCAGPVRYNPASGRPVRPSPRSHDTPPPTPLRRHAARQARSIRADMPLAGPIAQRLEQRTHNPLVHGSNPCGPTNSFRLLHLLVQA